MKRFFEYNFDFGLLQRGKLNSISDVAGVLVGHTTKIEGQEVRTGVTIIDPGASNLFTEKLPAAVAVGNGFGKLAGSTQIEELGTLETPIALTNTLAVGPVVRGVIDLVLSNTKNIKPTDSINAVVGETNDGFLNNLHADVVDKMDVLSAWENRNREVVVGCVGAGTGTRAFSWKGGIGTSSRVVRVEDGAYTVGILMQTNFGGALTICGVPVGKRLGKTDFKDLPQTGDGSCMVVLATDAPLSSRQLGRLASRTFLGLARTGSVLAHGSGDYAIAFTTSRNGIEGSGGADCLPDASLNNLFLAAVEAAEESVYDALFAASTVQGRDGNTLEALPVEKILSWLPLKK